MTANTEKTLTLYELVEAVCAAYDSEIAYWEQGLDETGHLLAGGVPGDPVANLLIEEAEEVFREGAPARSLLKQVRQYLQADADKIYDVVGYLDACIDELDANEDVAA